jgi:transcriptional regulator with GAF, ATPase, and Fis domain
MSGDTLVLGSASGRPALLVQKARLRVTKGPDRGKELVVDRPKVRIGSGPPAELRIADPAVSRVHCALEASAEGYWLRDAGSTNGTVLGGVRVRDALLEPGQTIAIGGTELRYALLDERAEIPLSPRTAFGALLGGSVAMRQLFAVLERVAPADSTILLEGESGTGKELCAEEVHRHSARAQGPFVVVDCAALPPTLVEDELFGHVKGAFTGATGERAGAFESAGGGTVFVDEIGELPLEAQPKLLRVLERKEVKRLGADRYAPADARVVAATHRDLEELVAAGRFREDLFWRLAVVRVPIPPLRERREDIPALAARFLASGDAQAAMVGPLGQLARGYAWPGNVRELRNVIERQTLFPEMRAYALLGPGATAPADRADLPFHEARRRAIDDFERGYVAAALAAHGGVVAHAATAIGLPRETLSRIATRLGLRTRDG